MDKKKWEEGGGGEFWLFSNTEIYAINRVEEIYKNIKVSMFPAEVRVLKLSKKRTFFTDVNKKSKSFKALYIYACESSHYTLSENDIFIGSDPPFMR